MIARFSPQHGIRMDGTIYGRYGPEDVLRAVPQGVPLHSLRDRARRPMAAMRKWRAEGKKRKGRGRGRWGRGCEFTIKG